MIVQSPGYRKKVIELYTVGERDGVPEIGTIRDMYLTVKGFRLGPID